MLKSDSLAIFVHQQNIERYRRLLQIPLDVQRRRAILGYLRRRKQPIKRPRMRQKREQ
jgi:hypothetical protein